MKSSAAIGTLLVLLVVSCDRQERRADASTKRPRGDSSAVDHPAIPMTAPPAGRDARDAEALAMADEIQQLADEDLAEFLESLAGNPDPALRRSALTVLYDESELRPAVVRLPLLLELARSADVAADVRATIMAELGATLGADHGTSWADWSLALEEHLANTEGLIRVE